MGLFKDGEAQKIPLDVEGPEIKPISLTHKFDRKDTVEFTVALELQMSTVKADWQQFMIPPGDLALNTDFDAADGFPAPLVEDSELNWHLRRNLEHVMSVCSVPLSSETDDKDRGMEDEARSWSRTGTGRKDQVELGAAPLITLQNVDGQEVVLHWTAATQDQQVALTCGDFGDHRVRVFGS